MALTISRVKQDVQGGSRVIYADVTFDASYVTAGEPLTAQDLGLTAIHWVSDQVGKTAAGTTAIFTRYDYVAQKLLAYWTGAAISSALAEVASTTNLSTFTVRIKVEGR